MINRDLQGTCSFKHQTLQITKLRLSNRAHVYEMSMRHTRQNSEVGVSHYRHLIKMKIEQGRYMATICGCRYKTSGSTRRLALGRSKHQLWPHSLVKVFLAQGVQLHRTLLEGDALFVRILGYFARLVVADHWVETGHQHQTWTVSTYMNANQ